MRDFAYARAGTPESAVGTLAEEDQAGRERPRTPAMAAGLADHVWSLQEWLSFPAKPC